MVFEAIREHTTRESKKVEGALLKISVKGRKQEVCLSTVENYGKEHEQATRYYSAPNVLQLFRYVSSSRRSELIESALPLD